MRSPSQNFVGQHLRVSGLRPLASDSPNCLFVANPPADKLSRAIQLFGNPPVFTSQEDTKVAEVVEESSDILALPDQFRGKKSKVAAKSGGQVYQWEIMDTGKVSCSHEFNAHEDYISGMTFASDSRKLVDMLIMLNIPKKKLQRLEIHESLNTRVG